MSGRDPVTGRKLRTSPWASAALAAALASVFALPVALSLVAIALGIAARRRIDRSPWLAGRELAVAAIVIGTITLLLGVIDVVAGDPYEWTAGGLF